MDSGETLATSTQATQPTATVSDGGAADGGSRETAAFAFEETFVCPRCNRPLAMYVQPIHLRIDTDCPRCSRPLTQLIRRAIREHHESLPAGI